MVRNTRWLLLLLSCCLSYHLQAQGVYLSVTQFGAKGDGVTDDTEAIEKAISASQMGGISFNKIPGVYGENGGVIYVGATKTVFFPLGTYKISRPIQVANYAHLLGERAILIPSGNLKKQGAAIQSSSWEGHFEGLQFIGFKTGIAINNNNLDCGKIQIENCDFICNGTAIDLTAVSSISIIRENRFFRNDKVIFVHGGDKVIVAENWITAGTLTGKQDAQIINYGVLHFDRNLLVPLPPAAGAVEPAWINNYGSVLVDGVRQGGEPGSFTLVNNFAVGDNTYPIWPNTVTIKNSECYAVYGNSSSYLQPTALRLIEFPNSVVLEDLRGFVDARVIDLSQADLKIVSKKLVNSVFALRMNNILGSTAYNDGNIVPGVLLKYVTK